MLALVQVKHLLGQAVQTPELANVLDGQMDTQVPPLRNLPEGQLAQAELVWPLQVAHETSHPQSPDESSTFPIGQVKHWSVTPCVHVRQLLWQPPAVAVQLVPLRV